jgi:hypothetical protein
MSCVYIVCSMIIDNGSCTSVTSISLVDKLNLHITKHHISYKLQWLDDCGEVKMFKKFLVSFFTGKYCNEGDVVHMYAGHILLGKLYMMD